MISFLGEINPSILETLRENSPTQGPLSFPVYMKKIFTLIENHFNADDLPRLFITKLCKDMRLNIYSQLTKFFDLFCNDVIITELGTKDNNVLYCIY